MKVIPLAVLLLIANLKLAYAPNTNFVILPKSEPLIELPIIDLSLNAWELALRSSESPDWTKCNEIGCMGWFQFKQSTLERLGFTGITPEKFKENPNIFPPEMQRLALKELIRTNATDLKDIFEQYIGQTVNGIEITKSGLLAAAHLAGVGGVKKFLEEDKSLSDKNGTTVACYLEKFGNYNI